MECRPFEYTRTHSSKSFLSTPRRSCWTRASSCLRFSLSFFIYDDLRKSTYLDAIVRDIRVIGFLLWKILGNPLISSPYKTVKVQICPLGMSKSRTGIRPDEFQTGVPRRETASTETDETSGVSNQFRWAIKRSKSSPWLLSFSFSPLFIFLHK